MSIDNFVQCRVVTPLSASSVQIVLLDAEAPYRLPPTGGGTLVLADSVGRPSYVEVISYTSRNGLVLYGVVRGLEGTTARQWDGVTYTYQALTAGGYQAGLDAKANANNAALTGIPTVPLAAPGTNTPQISSTSFVQQEIAALIAAAPGALNTLDELAAAMGDDPNLAATMTNALAGKEPTVVADVVTKFYSGTKTWRDLGADVRAIVLTGLSLVSGAAVVVGDSILVGIGKLQKQVIDLTTVVAGKEPAFTTLPLTKGGTGAVSAGAAATALGVGVSSAPMFTSLELSSPTPFIDFHYGSSGADYTSRLISEASGELKCYGILRATGLISSSGNISAYGGVFGSYAASAGANAHLWLYGEAGQNRAIVYAGADNILKLQAGESDQLWVNPGGYVTANQLRSNGTVYAGGTAAQLSADGNVYGSVWGNNWLSSVAITTTNMRANLANMRVNDLGSYCQAISLDANQHSFNTGVAGTSLYACSTQGGHFSQTLAGSWYCAGAITTQLHNTLWQRYV